MKLPIGIIRLYFFFAIVALLAACGGGGGVPAVSLDAVSPLFSNGADNNGAKWNDYVAGSNWRVTATDAAECNTLTDSACLHGGERRVVVATGKTSCAGLSAADDLGAFNWECDAATSPVRLVSTSLAADKGLSDLIDFDITPIPEFKPNKVTVFENGVAWGITPSSTWWPDNPIEVGFAATPIDSPSEIYVVLDNLDVPYIITASKVALVIKPGVTISNTFAVNNVILSSGFNHLWIEGNIDASGNNIGVNLANVHFSVLRNLSIANANSQGVVLSSSTNNILTGVIAANNPNVGVFLGSSSNNNTLSGITASNNQWGVVVNAASNSNTLAGITTSNNSINGIDINASNDNRLMSVTAVNNGSGGVILLSGANNNTLAGVTAANNALTGLSISGSNNNTLADVTVANNGAFGVALLSSTGNTFHGVLKVGNNIIGDCNNNNILFDCVAIGAFAADPITLANSFFGKVSLDDLENTSDDLGEGSAPFPTSDPSSLDWTRFENIYRGWGNEGFIFPPPFDFDATHQGQWTTGDGRIWDWTLLNTDTVNLNVATLPLSGNNPLTHTWSDTSETTFLSNAVEIPSGGVGNDNGLCETGETCLFTPNIGSYQGHGNLIPAAFNDGTDTGAVTGVTLLQFESNGTENLGPPIIPDSTPPTVNITSPQAGDFISFSTVTVSGTVSDNVEVDSVNVNGLSAIIIAGTFTVGSVPLEFGSNTLTAVATDSSGNTAIHSITVTFGDV